VERILSGQKTLEIRKTAPKEWADYFNGKTKKKPEPMVVYIYCTKNDYIGYLSNRYVGKVVAEFTLKEVYAICKYESLKQTYKIYRKDLAGREVYGLFTYQIRKDPFWKNSCLLYGELDTYLKGNNGYAWEIDDLKIFFDPKDLDQFYYPNPSGISNVSQRSIKGIPNKKHPPQSWCYVEESQ
jgi:predicted transcriptional regulator